MNGCYYQNAEQNENQYIVMKYDGVCMVSKEELEEEHGIKWKDVNGYLVKYGTIHIDMMDGTTYETDLPLEDCIDYKYPVSIREE